MCDAASLRVLSSKVAFASPQRLSALRASFKRTVGCLGERRFGLACEAVDR